MITNENKNKFINLEGLQHYHNGLMDYLRSQGLIKIIPQLCTCCGAPLITENGLYCPYCGTRFRYDK